MLYRTHAAFGLAVGLWFWNRWGYSFSDLVYAISFFALVLLGAAVIDLDHPKSKLGHKVKTISYPFKFIFGHRGFLHSLFFILIIDGLVLIFFTNKYSFPLLIGMVSHLVSDGFTKEGVNFIYPFHQLTLKGFIESGSISEFIVLFGSLAYIFANFFGIYFF